MYNNKIISAVIPAMNEAPSISLVVDGLFQVKYNNIQLFDYIVVCDNASIDHTGYYASKSGAIVVHEAQLGYGKACQTAIESLPKSDIIVFVDGDNSFYPEQSLDLVKAVDEGVDLVIGSRELGNIEKQALTIPQRFGNWLASRLIQLIWKNQMTDLGPFRAITFEALQKLEMKDEKFGWTVEMQIKAIQRELNVIEIPVDTRKRIGVSKISGTIKGVIGAALGIFGTILNLWLQEKNIPVNHITYKIR